MTPEVGKQPIPGHTLTGRLGAGESRLLPAVGLASLISDRVDLPSVGIQVM